MPVYCFTCEKGHKQEIFKLTPYKKQIRKRCPECGLWMYRDYKKEHSKSNHVIHLDNSEPISHLASKRSFTGKWVENCTPEPVFVRSKKEYQDLLKRTHSREKTSGFSG